MPRFGIAFQSDKSIEEYRELARIVDAYPFATVSVYQDLFFQPPWPALLQFAELTATPLVGPAVVNPYLTHPVLVAGHLAVIDEASRGRAYLGVGRGAFLDAIGVEPKRPLRAIREMVELVQRLVSGERGAYEGEIFQASSETYLRVPIPGRRLPVLLGGWGPRTARLAGEIADTFKVGGCANAESAPVFKEHLAEGASRAGRDPSSIRLVFGAVTVVDRDRRLAEEIARRKAATYVHAIGHLDPTYEPPERERSEVASALARGDEDAAAAALSRDTLDRFAVHGTPEDVVKKMEALFDAGVDRFELGTPHGLDEGEAIRLLGEEVLSHFEG